ncbi:hypothetical protein LQZ19_10460 [Treponema primitia]|uniref:hypothetical protein n=1 Tax=Treponema primitia TaxID=88058 RepID=UPI0039819142
MKKELFAKALFILAVFAVFTGCITTKGTNDGNFGEHIRTPVKDFQPVGLVFTETRLLTTDSILNNEGQIFTYQGLLKKAQELGADAIINVAIDKRVQITRFPGTPIAVPDSRVITWYGSALAIKYTATLTETGSVTVTADGATTTTVTTSVYFNDGGAANTGSTAAEPSAAGQAVSSAPSAPASTKGIRQ